MNMNKNVTLMMTGLMISTAMSASNLFNADTYRNAANDMIAYEGGWAASMVVGKVTNTIENAFKGSSSVSGSLSALGDQEASGNTCSHFCQQLKDTNSEVLPFVAQLAGVTKGTEGVTKLVENNTVPYVGNVGDAATRVTGAVTGCMALKTAQGNNDHVGNAVTCSAYYAAFLAARAIGYGLNPVSKN